MDNRKTLHDYSLIMICLAVLNTFSFVSTVIAGLVDGTIKEALDKVEPDMVGAVKIGLIIVGILMVILVFSDAFIGFKGLKVSREPNADNGYIVAAKVFFVLNIIAVISAIFSLTDKNTHIVDGILTLICSVADVYIYAIFIKAAKVVRQDAMKKE